METTTLRKLISEIDFNNKEMESYINWDGLCNEFNINECIYSDDERLKSYFIHTWYCTDTWVGLRAYFLDKEFVCTSWQSSRGMDEDFSFVSLDAAKKVKDFILSLIEKEKPINVVL